MLNYIFVILLLCRYTLRKAEYRLHLERKFDIHEEDSKSEEEEEKHGQNANHEISLDNSSSPFTSSARNDTLQEENHAKKTCGNMEFQNLGEMTSEVKEYIHVLESRLSSMEQVSMIQSMFILFNRLMIKFNCIFQQDVVHIQNT